MAVGDLSTDQQRFAQQVAAATGLDLGLVVAWIGAESGWGITKGTHNYLNIGPGRAYGDVDTAAAATAQLINTSSNYAGIRAAIPAGPIAQAEAIQQSPWDAAHYYGTRLVDTYRSLIGAGGTALAQLADIKLPGGVNIPFPGHDVTIDPRFPGGVNPGAGLGDIPFVGGIFKSITNEVVRQTGGVALGLIFTVFALVLIGMGVSRLTSINAGDVVDNAGKAATVTSIAKAAAL